MPLTITADGTSCTIAGSGGDAVTVKALQADAMAGWSSVGSRTGDGAVTATITAGTWWLYAQTASERSELVLTGVVGADDAIATQCRLAVAARLQLLDVVTADLGGRVYQQVEPDDTQIEKPCVICSVDNVMEQEDATNTNAFDSIGYPIKVMIADIRSQHDHSKLPTYELWRQRVHDAFRWQQWADGIVPGFKWSTIEPYVIADAQLPAYQHFVSGLLVRMWCYKPRGLNV